MFLASLKFWASTATTASTATKYRIYRGHLLPKAPAKAISGYTSFIKEHINNESGTSTEKMKALASKWKALPAQQKSKYNSTKSSEPSKHREDYNKQYVDKLTGSGTSFGAFVKAKTPEHKNMSLGERTKKMSEQWKGLGKEEKLKYIPEKKASSGLEHLKIPVEGKLSARQIFNRDNKDGKKWAELSEEQRKAYETKEKNQGKEYEQNLEKFAKDNKVDLKYLRTLITKSQNKETTSKKTATKAKTTTGPTRAKAAKSSTVKKSTTKSSTTKGSTTKKATTKKADEKKSDNKKTEEKSQEKKQTSSH